MSKQGVRHSGQQPMSVNHQQPLLYRMQPQAGQMHPMGFGIPSAAAPRTAPMQPASAPTIAPGSAGPRIMQHGTASGAHFSMQNQSFVPQHTMMQPAMFTPRASNQYPQAAPPFSFPYFPATQSVQQNQGYYPPASQIPQASYSPQVMQTQPPKSRNERKKKILRIQDPTSSEDLAESILRERDGVVIPVSSQVAGAGPSSSPLQQDPSYPQGNNRPSKERKIIPGPSVSQEETLRRSENAWKPYSKKKKEPEGKHDDEELLRRFKSILNKLTPQNFQKLMNQTMQLPINSEERLTGVTDLVFEKAIMEPKFTNAYANLCRVMQNIEVNKADGGKVQFRKLIIIKCQKQFERQRSDEKTEMEKKRIAALPEKEQEEAQAELAYQQMIAMKQIIGNIRFIGELFKLSLLTEKIMQGCIFLLLKAKDEESLECMSELVSIIGQSLDHQKGKVLMDQYLNQVDKIIKEKKISSRIRFKLQDLKDLRGNNWKPRRKKAEPVMIDQIRKEAEMEKQREEQEQLTAHIVGRQSKRPQGSMEKYQQEDGWNTFPGNRSTKLSVIETPSKTTITMKNQETVDAHFHSFDKIRRDANIKDEIGHQTEQKNQGAPSYPQGNTRQYNERKIISRPPVSKRELMLRLSENAWKPYSKKKKEPEDKHDDKELLSRFKSLLNKLTPQNFQKLMNQTMQLPINSEERLTGVIDLVFEKAIMEPGFSQAYANMCRVMQNIEVTKADGSKVQFRKLIIIKCQKQFERQRSDEKTEMEMKRIAALSEKEQEKALSELEYQQMIAKKQNIGNSRFIGELFKLSLLTEKVLQGCIFLFLKAGDEESLECMSELVSIVGQSLDHQKGKKLMDQFFNQIDKIMKEKKVSSRIRFMLHDLKDLRDNNWKPRRKKAEPVMIDQIRKEAEMEKQREEQEQLTAHIVGRQSKTPQGSMEKYQQEDGWNTFPGNRSTKLSVIETPSKTTITMKNQETVDAHFHSFDKIRRDANIKDEIGHQTEQKNQGASSYPQGNTRQYKERKIISRPPASKREMLILSENAWKPYSKKKKEPEDKHDDKELLSRFKSLLNKLTPQNFQKLMSQTMQLPINSEERLTGVIDLVFEKAIMEPGFSQAYANMCRVMQNIEVTKADGSKVQFRKLIIIKCQKQFERQRSDEKTEMEMKRIAALSEKEQEKALSELEYQQMIAKKQNIGNSRFIGELFKLSLLTEKVLQGCIFLFLKAGDEESLECMSELVSIVGQSLDHQKGKKLMDQFFNQIDKIMKEKKVSSRIRFMLHDLKDLRDNNWKPRREKAKPVMIDQIRKEAEMEKQREEQEQLTAHIVSRQSKRPQGSMEKYQQEDGWNTFPGNRSTKLSVIETPSKTTITMQVFDDNVHSSPGGRPGSLGDGGKGSRGGGGKSSLDFNISQGNRFMMLGEDEQSRSMLPPSARDNKGRSFSASEQSREREIDRSRERQSAIADTQRFTGSLKSRSNELDRNQEKRVEPPAVLALSEEEYEKRSRSTIKEFVHIKDFKEAITCLEELKSPKLQHVFVRVAIDDVLEKSSGMRESVGRLFHMLLQSSTISVEQFNDGLKECLEFAEDMEIDIPLYWTYLGEIIGAMAAEGATNFAMLRDVVQNIPREGKSAECMAEILKAGVNLTSETHMANIWKTSNFTWSLFLPSGTNIQEFVKNKKVSFTEQPVERVSQSTPKEETRIGNFQRDLILQFQNESLTNDAVFDFIEKSIPPDVRKTKEFIRALVSAVCFGAVKEEGTISRCDYELLKKRSVLMQRYIDSDAKLELQALFAVQHLNYSLENPPGLLRLYFDVLYNKDVISEETFYSWRDSDDAAEKTGKGIALKSVTSFYTWLEESDPPY